MTETQACEVPLTELMRDVPENFRASREIQWASNGFVTGHQMIPVGSYFHRAADRIEQLERALAESERSRDAFKDERARAVAQHEACAAKLWDAEEKLAERDKEIDRLVALNIMWVERVVEMGNELIGKLAERDRLLRDFPGIRNEGDYNNWLFKRDALLQPEQNALVTQSRVPDSNREAEGSRSSESTTPEQNAAPRGTESETSHQDASSRG